MAVASGAIVVIGSESGEYLESDSNFATPAPLSLTEGPLACLEVLGRSPLERTIERIGKSGIDRICLLVEDKVADFLPIFRREDVNPELQIVDDCLFALSQKLEDFCAQGLSHAFVVSANAFLECDYEDFLQFHRERRQAITRASDVDGPLDLWAVDCNKAQEFGISSLLTRDTSTQACYSVRDYVNRLSHPADIRRLVVDAFHRRCQLRPDGHEFRPGVWMEDDTDIHRRTRIVAPAYIGRGTKICEDTLVTRYSSIESWSHVDYGTVIENSSVLSNSYVGIWLDVSHAVVCGSKLMNLTRNVVLELSDPSIIRKNTTASRIIRRDKALVSRLMAFASSD